MVEGSTRLIVSPWIEEGAHGQTILFSVGKLASVSFECGESQNVGVTLPPNLNRLRIDFSSWHRRVDGFYD